MGKNGQAGEGRPRRAWPSRAVRWILPPLVVALAAAAYVVGGRPVALVRAHGGVLHLAADSQGLVWLQAQGDRTAGGDQAAGGPGPGASAQQGPATGRLMALPTGAHSPQVIYQDPNVIAMALAGDRVFALRIADQGATGALLEVPRSGGAPRERAGGLSVPRGLVVSGGHVYWTETVPGRPLPVSHIPALGPKTVVREMPVGSGSSPGLVALASGSENGFSGELLGLEGGRFYWIDFRPPPGGPGWSITRVTGAEGGAATPVRTDGGQQTGLLQDGGLYYTAPSEDAGDPQGFCCVRRAVGPEASPVTLTDWLNSGGRLVVAGGHLYHVAFDGVWAVPDRLAKPRRLGAPGHPTGAVAAYGGMIFEASSGLQGREILARPVTTRARLRALGWRLLHRTSTAP